MKKTLILLSAIVLSGCANITIPNGQLEEYNRRTVIFGVVSETDVKNIQKSADGTVVGDAEITVSAPGIEHRQTLKGLKLDPKQ